MFRVPVQHRICEIYWDSLWKRDSELGNELFHSCISCLNFRTVFYSFLINTEWRHTRTVHRRRQYTRFRYRDCIVHHGAPLHRCSKTQWVEASPPMVNFIHCFPIFSLGTFANCHHRCLGTAREWNYLIFPTQSVDLLLSLERSRCRKNKDGISSATLISENEYVFWVCAPKR